MPLPFKSLANWDSEDQVPHGENIVIRHSLMIAATNIHHVTSEWWFLEPEDPSFCLSFLRLFKALKGMQHMACVDYQFPIECDVLKPAAVVTFKDLWHQPFICIHTCSHKISLMNAFKVKPVYEITLKDL